MHSTVNSTLPLVSVIAVCYNHARYVIDCLESLRTQSYPNVQIILFDDASKDNSVEVIKNWIDHNNFNCQFVPHASNRGLCRTLNEALSLARGKYITLIATDDTWQPDRLNLSVNLLEAAPKEVGVVFTDVYQMDEEGVRLPLTFLQSILQGRKVPEGIVLEALIKGNFVPAMSALIRRTVYDKIGNYDERLLYEDWDFWLRAAEHFRFTYVDQKSANYRIVSTSMARTQLANGSPASVFTYFLIHHRLLNNEKLSESSMRLILQRVADAARELYCMGHPELPRMAHRFIALSNKSSSRLMSILCWAGVPWATYVKYASYWRWRISALTFRKP